MAPHSLTDEQVAQFHHDGYLVVEGLLSAEESDLLLRIAKADSELAAGSVDRKDAEGGASKISLRYNLPDDIYSAIVRSERVVSAMEKLLGSEVYHFHHKMMMKEPLHGGAWEWHQDYGYWYNHEGFLFPDLASCMIAVDRATRENGCLQVLRGSHRMGRLEHGVTGDQAGADLERVDEALKRLELVYCEFDPGTAVFFHSNTLHRSDANKSPHARWSFIACYSTRENTPFKDVPQAQYEPLDRWPDTKILEVGRRHLEQIQATQDGETAS